MPVFGISETKDGCDHAQIVTYGIRFVRVILFQYTAVREAVHQEGSFLRVSTNAHVHRTGLLSKERHKVQEGYIQSRPARRVKLVSSMSKHARHSRVLAD